MAKKKVKASKPKIIIRDKIYVPRDYLDIESVKREYTTNLYDDNACKTCEYMNERHCSVCNTCPAFKERIVLFKPRTIGGQRYIGLPVGDKKNVERKARIMFSEFRIVDKRTQAPFDYPIKFTAKLRPVQDMLVNDFMEEQYGLVEAPPRTGKTITSLYICLKLGQRTLILANQHEFLTQFMDHIHGNEKEGIPKCTNLPELERKYKKKLYGIPKTDEDFNNFQFMCMTYQAFISEKNGKNRLKKIALNVGTLGIDEVHKANATCFASVVSSVRTRYKFGVTGTVKRKDGKHFIVKALLGPVTARTSVEALVPTVYIHKTEVEGRIYKPGPAAWVYSMQYLSKHEKRNKQIVERVIKDLKNGHNIVIPVTFKKHALELQNMINKAYGSHICETFFGGGGAKNKDQRKDTLTLAKENKIRVIVGIRSLLQLGLNVPTWSAIYTVIPISNEPNYKQETSRVCTPLAGKRPPIIRLFVDMNQPQSAGCARSSIKHMQGFKYAFAKSEKQQELLIEVLSSGRRRRSEEDDEFTPVRTQRSSRSKTFSDDIPSKGLFTNMTKKRL